jgi:hypothetical protein
MSFSRGRVSKSLMNFKIFIFNEVAACRRVGNYCADGVVGSAECIEMGFLLSVRSSN